MRFGYMLLALMLTGCGFTTVDTGYRGVKTNFGKLTEDNPIPEGFHWYNPFTTDIIHMEVREQKLNGKTVAYTSDVQNVTVGYVINFFPDRSKIHLFYKEFGRDWADKIVSQIITGNLKEVVGKYGAVQLISNRAEAVSEIETLVTNELAKRDVTVKKLEITDFDYNDAFEEAVEKKVIAKQKAEEAKNKTVQVEEEARQKIISSKAEAESMRIRSQALSQNKSLVEYEAVQKWDGKMPQYMMGNSVPFINMSRRLGE